MINAADCAGAQATGQLEMQLVLNDSPSGRSDPDGCPE